MQGLSSQLRETTVEVESSGLCTVLLARPERGNGYTQRMADELDWIFRAANADDAVKVVVLAGQGSRFCVGVDLGGSVDGAAADTMNTGQAERDVGGVASLSVYHCRKPVIAALHGAAIGIGITVALPCDIRIAEEDCKFGFAFARRGLSVEAACSYFLPRIVGQGKALDFCLTGRVFAAKDEPSLFTQVVPRGEALKRARSVAHDMLANCSLVSLVYIKASLQANALHPHDAHEFESRFIGAALNSPEAVEGFTSFLEKRAPRFPGIAKDADFQAVDWHTKARAQHATRRSKL